MFDPSSFVSFGTRAVHAGLTPDPVTGAILTPLYQTTTYVQPHVGAEVPYTYSRCGNPTVAALEAHLGALEQALPAVCFSTGMAAIAALILGTCRSGDHVVCGEVVYGGTVRFLRELAGPLGITSDFVDATDPTAVALALRPETRLVLVETPANPTLVLTDVAAVSASCRAHGATLAVDNTFLTPALQQPLDLGADVTVTSTTKYVEGHNATVGGALVTRSPELAERFRFVRKTSGAPLAPFDAWLTLRGSKTLHVRMAHHSESALQVASFLACHPAVARVAYPFLPGSPTLALARRQQKGGGGTLAFELHGGLDAGRAVVDRLRLWALAESLGAVESLVTHPATMTHGSVPPDQRRRSGITDGLVRLSVGLEDVRDLILDLDQALSAAGGAR